MLKEVAIVCGPATMELSARTFQSATNYKGEMSAAAYAMGNTGGWRTNKRMPDAATFESVDDVQQAILYRKGRSMLGGAGAMRTAVCPHWNEVSIDDIYSGSASGERFFHDARAPGRRDPRAAGRLRPGRLQGRLVVDFDATLVPADIVAALSLTQDVRYTCQNLSGTATLFVREAGVCAIHYGSCFPGRKQW